MKKALLILSAIFLMTAIMPTLADAQLKTRKELKLERKKRKQALNKLKDKSIKAARQKAKEYNKKFGWREFPGGNRIDKMIEESWLKMNEKKTDDNFNETNAYVWGIGNSVAQTKSAAKMEAIARAKIELAGLVKSHVAALTTSNIANSQLSNIDAETTQSIVQSAKIITAAKLNNLVPVVVLMRTKIPRKGLKESSGKKGEKQLKPGMTEVQATVFYDLYQLDFQVRDAIKNGLKEKLKDNEAELKKLMDL